MEIGFKTHKGMVRANNEDACFIIPEKDIYIVADGVGGNKSGEVASRTCVYEITQYVNEHELPDAGDAAAIKDYFSDCIEKVNTIINEKAGYNPMGDGMATTVVICYVKDDYAYICHVGDSRAYICRNGKLTQVTEDHTYVNALIKAGVISEEEALTHEDRHKITRAIGAEEYVKADFKQVSILPGDIILLCTDGLFGEVSEEKITEIITQQGVTMSSATSRLVEEANQSGGADNVTIVCLKV